MKNKIISFEELNCWKACRDVRIDVMKLIKKFPPEEKYALTDGMRRASDEEYITKSEYSNGRILIKRAQ